MPAPKSNGVSLPCINFLGPRRSIIPKREAQLGDKQECHTMRVIRFNTTQDFRLITAEVARRTTLKYAANHSITVQFKFRRL